MSFIVLEKGQLHLTNREHRSLIINAAIVIDTIWQTRNGVMHRGEEVNLQRLINYVNARVSEHFQAWQERDSINNKIWKPPDWG